MLNSPPFTINFIGRLDGWKKSSIYIDCPNKFTIFLLSQFQTTEKNNFVFHSVWNAIKFPQLIKIFCTYSYYLQLFCYLIICFLINFYCECLWWSICGMAGRLWRAIGRSGGPLNNKTQFNLQFNMYRKLCSMYCSNN